MTKNKIAAILIILVTLLIPQIFALGYLFPFLTGMVGGYFAARYWMADYLIEDEKEDDDD